MSGSFELHDPRGFPKYPFEHHHSIKPTEGDLVLFPGWMPHGVLPTYGPEPRIAIAFNLQVRLAPQGVQLRAPFLLAGCPLARCPLHLKHKAPSFFS